MNLSTGQSHTIADGTTVTFDGYQRWVSVQVSHDPAQIWVLVSSVVMLGGLLVSLLIRRRRIWARLVPAVVTAGQVDGDDPDGAGRDGADPDGVDPSDGKRRTVVEIAGLARTDQAGWG